MAQIDLKSGAFQGSIVPATLTADRTYTLPDSDGTLGGKIGQVLQVYKTDAFTLSTSTTWTDITDLTLAITPVATSSKILIMSSIFHSSDAYGGSLYFRFVRTTTAIGIADAAGSRPLTSFTSYVGDVTATGAEVSTDMSGNTFLDEPITTSATTYKIQGFIGGTTQYVNRSIRDNDGAGYDPRGSSSLTLMEVLV